jgi:hypothetical protein
MLELIALVAQYFLTMKNIFSLLQKQANGITVPIIPVIKPLAVSKTFTGLPQIFSDFARRSYSSS